MKAAKNYCERKGITYSTWREVGVPAEVLKKAGISRRRAARRVRAAVRGGRRRVSCRTS